MQKTINIISKTALAIIAAFLATGCFFEKMDMPKDLQDVLIQINVSTDGMQTRSAATDAEKGIEDLRIYAFHGDDLAGYMHITGASEEVILMDLTLPVAASVPVDFYLIANGGNMKYENGTVTLTENMTKAELRAIKYTSLQGAVLPLYCEATHNLNTTIYDNHPAGPEGHETHIPVADENLVMESVDFKLSRSLAKLSVYGAKKVGSTSEPQILSVTMLASGTREYSYLFPQTDDILNAVMSRANDRGLLSVPVTVAELAGDGTAAAHYTPVVTAPTYLSEVAVGGTPAEWAVLAHDRQVALKVEYVLNDGGAVKTGFVYMPRIERNTHYKVCILISEENEGTINIAYEVADWNNHEMPDYSFTYPSHSYIRQSIPVSGEDVTSPSSAATMSETSPFVGYFQMTAPANDEWQPTLTGNNASGATIKVYEEDTTVEVDESTWPIEASAKWYRIEVVPDPDFVIGETVNLAITYQPELTSTFEYLLVNGTAGNYYWPDSEDANYITITMVN